MDTLDIFSKTAGAPHMNIALTCSSNQAVKTSRIIAAEQIR